MTEPAALRVVVSGRVQGVMFRDFTCRQAEGLSLTGYVRNLPDGRAVEVEAEGERPRLEKFLEMLRQGSPRAAVENFAPSWGQYTGKYQGFSIRF